jgi:putative chitinase
MGNRPGTDDGWIYRGQGFSQTTGRGIHDPPKPLEGFAALAKVTGLDLIGHPELLCDPAHALDCAVGDFIQCGCLPYAEKDDLIGVSSMLNVGHYVSNTSKINGYAMRKNWLALWKHALGIG